MSAHTSQPSPPPPCWVGDDAAVPFPPSQHSRPRQGLGGNPISALRSPSEQGCVDSGHWVRHANSGEAHSECGGRDKLVSWYLFVYLLFCSFFLLPCAAFFGSKLPPPHAVTVSLGSGVCRTRRHTRVRALMHAHTHAYYMAAFICIWVLLRPQAFAHFMLRCAHTG